MRLATILIVLLLCCPVASYSAGMGTQSLLRSEEFVRLKDLYQKCVLAKGSQMMNAFGFQTAVEYAPIACKRDLLKIKRMMLDSAFKRDVMDGLMASIAEGVEIDLVIALLQEKTGK
ncbi:MAG: hypothetical protein ACI9GW_003159 [Halieaceae bacterium]|jgi:hypothetical protein